MKTEDIRSGFPDSIKLPDTLSELCEWHRRNGPRISGYFELYADTHESIWHWFGTPSAVDRFGVFGAGPDGSLYAIWRQDDGRQPIVHLGSEGIGNFVLAPDFVSFLRLLAVGYEEIGFDDLSVPPVARPNIEFQEWVTRTYSVTIPSTGSEITGPAQASHDDLQQWIERIIE